MDIRSAQQRAWENKVAKGFNTTDIPLEFCLLQGDIAEAFATWAGITGHDDQLPDLSPDGFAGRAELDRSALTALDAAAAPGRREQVARTAMQERLAIAVERYDAGDTTSELNVIDSWVQGVRELFDSMPTEGEEAAVHITRRMAAVPAAYRQLAQTLLDVARHGRPPTRLQAEEVARQCADWSDPADSLRTSTPGRSAWAPWAWTRSARPWPAPPRAFAPGDPATAAGAGG